MIVLVTGDRDYLSTPILFGKLDEVHARTPITEIRNGGMTGADALSSRWAYSRKVNTRCVGAQWGDLDSAAGPARNIEMLEMEPIPNLVVAFPGPNSRGTWQCVKAAEGRGVEVDVVLP